MGRGRNLSIFKVEGQISRSVDLCKDSGTWICVGRIEQELCSFCAETYGSGRSQLNFKVK